MGELLTPADIRRSELHRRAEVYFDAVERDDDAAIRELWAVAEREADWRFVLAGCSMAWHGRNE